MIERKPRTLVLDETAVHVGSCVKNHESGDRVGMFSMIREMYSDLLSSLSCES
jgi:hypothetical protein